MFNIPSRHQHQPSDYSSLNLEVNRLKLVVTDIKSQNAELESILSNVCINMKEMASKYNAVLKMKDYEIATLKKNIHELSEINDFAERSEIEDNPELIQSEVISDVENDVPRWYSSCSNSSTSDTDDSSQKSQSSDESNSTIKDNVEKSEVDKQIITSPNIDEWTVVNKKRKDHVNKKKIKKMQATYPPSLEVENGWTHLHLYNVLLGTTEKTVLTYIKSLCGYSDCTVKLLKTRAEYASFKIGVPVELAERILMKENWTGNIRIKPWKMNTPPRKLLKDPISDNSKTDEKDKASITTQNLILNKAISNTNSGNSKTDSKEKEVSSIQNLPAKKIVKNTSSVNSKTEEKNKISTANQKDFKSKTSKSKKN